MAYKLWYVFRWRFTQTVEFVFVGNEFTPRKIWRRRHEFDSQLHDVLRTLEVRPLAKRVLASPVYATEARAIKKGLERTLRAKGVKLLSSRNRATIKAGHKSPRPVYVETAWGRTWHPSVRAAARALGVDHSTISLAAKNPSRTDVYYDTSTEK